jgi:hypothetical protein
MREEATFFRTTTREAHSCRLLSKKSLVPGPLTHTKYQGIGTISHLCRSGFTDVMAGPVRSGGWERNTHLRPGLAGGKHGAHTEAMIIGSRLGPVGDGLENTALSGRLAIDVR